MKKYAISREFFHWNLFAPPISEKFLAMSVPYMKPPKSLWQDKKLDVTTHEIESYDGEKITCFVLSPKNLPAKAPCLIYLHGGGFVLEAAGYHYSNAICPLSFVSSCSWSMTCTGLSAGSGWRNGS